MAGQVFPTNCLSLENGFPQCDMLRTAEDWNGRVVPSIFYIRPTTLMEIGGRL